MKLRIRGRYVGRRHPLLAAGTALVMLASGLSACSSPPAPDQQTSSCANLVVCENEKIGVPPSVWQINGAGDPTIQGYATDIGVNAGGSIDFKISTKAKAYTIDIYRLGYYGGLGARKVASVPPSAPLPQAQPACIADPSTALYDCGTWAVSASWAVPRDAVSGVYEAKLIRTDTGGASQIIFVVRDDASRAKVYFKTADATWVAYNLYGGADFYAGGNAGRAYKISYNQPFSTRGDAAGRSFLFSNEYPMIEFLERNGYDVTYTTDVDADRHGDLIKNHQVFLSVGHDEYWSYSERDNVEAARDAGVNLAFFSGNEVYWRTRWESSKDGRNTPYRTLVCYKETWANRKIDPNAQWTGTFRDPRFAAPANGGGDPENSLTGTMYMANDDDLPLQVPAEQGKLRFWRNTSLSTMPPGTIATLAQHVIGYESDEDVDNGFRPPGLIDMSTTEGKTPLELTDFGDVSVVGTTTHHLTMYRAKSGALVFGAGTVQWGWGLDVNHDGTSIPPSPVMQQATINVLADMGAEATTVMTGMVKSTPSTDRTPPTASVTAPAAGARLRNGAALTLTGTATDTGGVVATVEVSTDNGASWHRATGTSSWSYRMFAAGTTTETILVRAEDDSLNRPATPTSYTLALRGAATLFGDAKPAVPAVGSRAEVGIKFIPSVSGTVAGIRFYKGPGNGGTHIGSLWTVKGRLLASGTFTHESPGGWQTLLFSHPIPVAKAGTYIASYYAPKGHWSYRPWAFAYVPWTAGPLTVPGSWQVHGNGLYANGHAFPRSSPAAANYYVDVLFRVPGQQ